MAELQQALAQDAFGQVLRQHQRLAVGFGRCRCRRFHRLHFFITAIGAVLSLRRIVSAGGTHAVGHAQRFAVALMSEMAMPLERALLPLLVRIDRRGPIGVVELADVVGRDYTTVSRQVARLDELGLVVRRAGALDKRVREAEVTQLGREMADAIDRMRERIVGELMADWSAAERRDLARLMKRFANDASEWLARRQDEDAAE